MNEYNSNYIFNLHANQILNNPVWKNIWSNYKKIWREKNPTLKWIITPHSELYRVFPQAWENSGHGIDVDLEGKSYPVLDTFSQAYTTVIKETVSNTYFVYFDTQLAYIVPTYHYNYEEWGGVTDMPYGLALFFDDLKSCNLLPRSKSYQYIKWTDSIKE